MSELLKLLLWAQDKLLEAKVNFPVMTDLVTATLVMSPTDITPLK